MNTNQIEILGSTILNALSEVALSAGKEFHVNTHSVYRLGKTMRRQRKKNSRPSLLYTTFPIPVKTEDVFLYPFNIQEISFAVVENSRGTSLSHSVQGANMPVRRAGLSEALMRTSACNKLTEDIKKTLILVSKQIAHIQPSPFIVKVLGCIASDRDRAIGLLNNIGSVQQFFEKLMKDKCIVTDSIVTVGASDLMLKDIVNNVTAADWKSYCSFSQQSSSSNSLVPFPVSPVLPTGDLLWSFLEGRDCHVTLENSSCVDLKTFSVTSIRNVVLVLHRPYKLIPVKTLFRVERFSGTVGSVDNGKDLIGHFEILFRNEDIRSDDLQRWNPEGVKLSHIHFVIVDQESPDA